ncbi:WD40 repeat-like protein [Pseudovirgaria hyperparasitica]|uniref:Polyadenylation factor subunit 2 n=1 Tax=Pseudovirgaria hyperparasitica TaxID=470096 RepID=A0A6A6WNE8_9PEZI|nr:WD40 repeat-like protein [Pseudovirgaria hyperparasitica]KAF2763569.1 WD40 repeat-like protein [Pseudovirgaria hyperparasitica]
MDRDNAFPQPYEAGRPRPKRPVTDYGSTMVQWMRNRRPNHKGGSVLEMERPSASYIIDMLPPAARPTNAAATIPVRHLHSSLNKIKHPVNVVRWTPEGRRLLTGSTSGEFTLWNGMGFNFETIMQAHDAAILGADWSSSGEWLVSGDKAGVVKYWQPNFNNVKAIQAHNEPIRDMAFAPTDVKFVTASDDASLKIWDFAAGAEESTLTGHNWETRCVDWHPRKGLLVSGSKDHQVKLWDPRSGRCLTTLHGHKNSLQKTKFEPVQGDLLATCARDHTARIFDLRMMRDVLLLKGHEKDIITLTWHPVHKNLLSTGGFDGALFHYLLDEQNLPDGAPPTTSVYESADPTNAPAQTIYPAHRIEHAHEYAIWTLDWHPLGHILASGSNDKITRFWTRARPGESHYLNDTYHIGRSAAEAMGTWSRADGRRQMREEEEQEEEDEADGLEDQNALSRPPLVPGLPGISLNPEGHTATSFLPGIGNTPAPLIPLPGAMPPLLPGMDPNKIDMSKLHEMFGGQFPPPPIPPPNGAPPGFPPPPGGLSFPGFPGGPPPPPHMLPPGFMPPGFPPPIPPSQQVPIPPQNGGWDANGRRRAPLPSQQDSLMEEMKRGNYRKAR